MLASRAVQWEWEEDLLYLLPSQRKENIKCMRVDCLERESERSFAACSKCGAKFCSRECLLLDWKHGAHKRMCGALKRMKEGFNRGLKREAVLSGVLGRVRLYAFPFLVHHRDQRGQGALFVQSPQPLEDFFFEPNVTSNGNRVFRVLFLSFVTQSEFDSDITSADFELALAGAALKRAVEASKQDESKAAILLRFRCGYVAVIICTLVPDLQVCRALASDYIGKTQLQLNVDET